MLFSLSTQAILTTASNPEMATKSSAQASIPINIKEMQRTIITFILFRTQCLCAYAVSKNTDRKNPTSAPNATPSIIEIGIFTKSIIWTWPPCAMLTKAVNRTTTKISSQEAPAIMNWGILFCVPYLLSISCTIFGTTTAGETAPRTAPITAASILETSSKSGAKRKKAKISKPAGTQDIIIAGRPTFFKSERLRESPAFKRIIMSAICRNSDDIDRIDGSNTFNTYGPKTMPVISIPIMRGSFHFWQIAAVDSPIKNIKASDVNMKILLIKKGSQFLACCVCHIDC